MIKVDGVMVDATAVGSIDFTKTPKTYSASLEHSNVGVNEVELGLKATRSGHDKRQCLARRTLERVIYQEAQISEPFIYYVDREIVGIG